MHLVGFTVEIYYDARPSERQKFPSNTLGRTPNLENKRF